jgi:hypothetical protein
VISVRKPWAMLWRLGAVVSLCVALVACTPGEYKGRVIAGLDDGVLDEVPQGWSSDEWSLPDHDTVEVSVDTRGGATGQVRQHLDAARIDLAAVPPLPDDAREQATEDC